MPTPLSVLILEDYAADMQLMVYELRQAGFEVKWQHVDNRDDYLAQLNADYDLILADYSLPGFDAMAALQLLQERDLDIPFIIVTGSISEEVAVSCMKQGAADYLLKDRLGRLGQAVNQALESKRRRQEKKQADAALQQATDQLRAVLDAVPGGVSWVSSDLKYLGINRYLISTFHLTPEEFIGQHIGFLQCSPEFADFARHVFEAPERSAYKEVDITVDGASRQYLFMAQKYAGGQAAVFVGVDITERKKAEQQLLHDAFYDKLTERPNRALFMDRLQQAIVRTKRHSHYQFAVLFLDLDRFKNVNDSLGHMAGDQLLVIISNRLEQCVRPIDTVARLGGDEFAILLDGIKDLNDATAVAERIHRELRSPLNLEGHEVFTNASIGIAMSASGYEQPEDVLRDADTAMYRAKTLGKGRHEVFDAEMRAQAVSVLQLENDLQRAIDRKELRVHYQPLVALKQDQIIGFEALVRWQHPKRGLIQPGEFIPVAEETGLIIPIGHWVLCEACQQIKLWQEQFPARPPLTMSVNLSPRQFSQPDLIAEIAQILDETGLNPRSLKLEITESAIMENAESATLMLQQLRELGVQLSIDDFGTGYSSLSYLHRFPTNALKIDRSFVSQMGMNGENAEIVRTIVSLAHNLGMEVVAEGVETASQLEQLKGMKCKQAQGYLFSKPVNARMAETLLRKNHELDNKPSPAPQTLPAPRRVRRPHAVAHTRSQPVPKTTRRRKRSPQS